MQNILNKTRATEKHRKLAESDSVYRRHELLRCLAREFPPGFLLPEESIAILFAPLDLAKRTINAARIRLRISKTETYSVNQSAGQNGSILLPRPAHALSRLNRADVFPPNVPPAPEIKSRNLTTILDHLRNEGARGVLPHVLLDYLATSLALDWSTAAKLLLNAKVVTESIDERDITITRRAREFWIRYSDGRTRFGAFLQIMRGHVPSGDWALFSDQQLEALLANIIMPDHTQRSNYLSNYIHSEDCLDLYSETWLPLVRHPFPSQFNPLVFGRAKQLTLS